MSVTLSYTNYKARKEHKCSFCGGIIPIGMIYQKQVIVHDGGLYTWKSHYRCLKLVDKLRMHDHCDEGVTSEDFYESVKERYNDFIKDETYPENLTWEEILEIVMKHYDI